MKRSTFLKTLLGLGAGIAVAPVVVAKALAAPANGATSAIEIKSIHGIEFEEFKTEYGTLLVRRHDKLERLGFSNRIRLDIENFETHTFKPLN